MANTSTTSSKPPTLDVVFASIPGAIRTRLVRTYLDLKRRHVANEYDASGLSAGKYCETVLRLLQHRLHGQFTPFGQKIVNFANDCQNLAQTPTTAGTDSERIMIPRALLFLYTLRNKRGIGHTGGDVDANQIDSITIARVSDWITCELIRLCHALSLEDAQAVVDSLSTRELPAVWQVGGKKRVLTTGLTYAEQVLLFLYNDPSAAILTEDLLAWTEYSSLGMFKKSVLTVLHKKRLIEYDRESELVYISPTGIAEVEANVLPKTQ